MIDHLVKLGHRRLGFISGHFDQRQQVFIDAVNAHGLPSDPTLQLLVPFGIDGWTPEMGQVGAQHLMNLAEPPDANS